MEGLYVPELSDILRAGDLNVEEIYGWETLARTSGGFDNNRVEGICIHHDGSSSISSPDSIAIYLAYGAEHAPISNLYLDRNGTWWCVAAGANNGQGLGGPWHTIPVDQANRKVISIEIANNGQGEPYSIAQQQALLKGVALLWNHFSIRFDWGVESWRVFSHFEWAPARKIDPAGPSIWMSESDRYKKWDMTKFRHDVIAKAIDMLPKPEPQPEPDVLSVADGIYMVFKGEGPWTVASKIYGDGRQYPILVEANPGTWSPSQLITIPDIVGFIVTVKMREGPYSLIRRVGLTPNTATLKSFYLFNGGQSRVLKPGDKVFIRADVLQTGGAL